MMITSNWSWLKYRKVSNPTRSLSLRFTKERNWLVNRRCLGCHHVWNHCMSMIMTRKFQVGAHFTVELNVFTQNFEPSTIRALNVYVSLYSKWLPLPLDRRYISIRIWSHFSNIHSRAWKLIRWRRRCGERFVYVFMSVDDVILS